MAFLITSLSLLVGITTNSTHATGNASVGYAVTIEPAMAVTVSSNEVNLSLNPMSNRPFGSASLGVTVVTNNKPGYELYMSSDSTNLVNTTDSTETIPTLPDNGDTGYTENTFVDNKWGYKIGNANYFPFTSDDMIDSYDDMTDGRTTTLGFAAKVDATKPAGTYSNTLTFSAVPKVATIDMQNLNPSLCTSTPITVSDTRDSKLYTVARLADGQCWMVSNLNLAGGTALYSESSDVPDGYPRTGGTAYFTLPTSETITSGTSLPSTAFSNSNTAYVFNSGNETTDQTDCISSQPCNSYYSWKAATAGGKDASGTSVTTYGGRTAYSICPKGWKLPSATTDGVSADNGGYTGGDFYKLAIQYGLSPSDYSQDTSNFYNQAGPGTLPNFLLTGGYSAGSFAGGGSDGYYWSSSSYSSAEGYGFDFVSNNISSASIYPRFLGFSVRCILRES